MPATHLPRPGDLPEIVTPEPAAGRHGPARRPAFDRATTEVPIITPVGRDGGTVPAPPPLRPQFLARQPVDAVWPAPHHQSPQNAGRNGAVPAPDSAGQGEVEPVRAVGDAGVLMARLPTGAVGTATAVGPGVPGQLGWAGRDHAGRGHAGPAGLLDPAGFAPNAAGPGTTDLDATEVRVTHPDGEGPDGTGPNAAGEDGTDPTGAAPDGTDPNAAGPDAAGPDGMDASGAGPDGAGIDGTAPDGTPPDRARRGPDPLAGAPEDGVGVPVPGSDPADGVPRPVDAPSATTPAEAFAGVTAEPGEQRPDGEPGGTPVTEPVGITGGGYATGPGGDFPPAGPEDLDQPVDGGAVLAAPGVAAQADRAGTPPGPADRAPAAVSEPATAPEPVGGTAEPATVHEPVGGTAEPATVHEPTDDASEPTTAPEPASGTAEPATARERTGGASEPATGSRRPVGRRAAVTAPEQGDGRGRATGPAKATVPAKATEAARAAGAGTGSVDLGSGTVWSADGVVRLRERWQAVAIRFIDEPDGALDEAKSLVTDAVRRLAEQVDLDPRGRTGQADTEAMRLAMRRYRDFLDRVLAL